MNRHGEAIIPAKQVTEKSLPDYTRDFGFE